MAKRKKSTLQHHADAKDAAGWADEFADMTSKKLKPGHISKRGTGMSSDPPKDMGKVRKYGKWAKEEAASAHKSRSAALKQNRENNKAKTTRPKSKFKPHGYTQGDPRK
jgi:hypothetical protein